MTLPTNETPPSPNNQSQSPRMVSIALPTYKPVATMIILAVTVIIYLGQVLTQSSLNGNDLLFILGGKINSLIEQGQIWRLITPVFLHASISHVLLNMYALFILGKVLESAYGHGRFLLLYFISAFAGNVMSFIMSANASLGASTAIFGLIGAEAIFVIRNKRFYGTRYQSTIFQYRNDHCLESGDRFLAWYLNRLLGTPWRVNRWELVRLSGRSPMGCDRYISHHLSRRPAEEHEYCAYRLYW